MEHKDKLVREEAKSLIVELHRWIGAAITTHIASLKPVQVSICGDVVVFAADVCKLRGGKEMAGGLACLLELMRSMVGLK